MKKILYFFSITFLLFGCQPKDGIRLTKGLILSKSVVVSNKVFKIDGEKSTDKPVLIIKGSNIEIDFNGATLQGSNDKNAPEDFYGLGILVENGKNITLKNLNVHGYKIGLKGLDVEDLTLENCDFSYNYRPKFKKGETSKNEDKNTIAAVILEKCNNATIKNTRITEGQNGVLLSECNNGLFYNNKIQFNSGFGINLLNSGENRVLNNQLDWNIRNYWDKSIVTDDASGGILIQNYSPKNVIAYNSITHCSMGIWTDIDSDEKRPIENTTIYGNDCSFATHSGIGIPFTENTKIIGNITNKCFQSGIRGSTVFNAMIAGNVIENCQTGIYFPSSKSIKIRQNEMFSCSIAVNVYTEFYSFEEPLNPKNRISIDHNLLKDNKAEAIIAENDSRINIVLNQFVNTPLLSNTNLDTEKIKEQNEINPVEEKEMDNADFIVYAPSSLPDGMNTNLSGRLPQGRQNILMNEYGSYSFRYPKLWLRTQKDGEYVFALFGPYGNWKLKNAEGLERISLKTGTTPATIVANKSNPDSYRDGKPIKIELEFIGEAIETQFGEKFEKGTPFQFGWIEE